MRKRIIIALITVTVCITTFCIYFINNYMGYVGNRPIDQPNTSWKSDDPEIYISVDSSMQSTGYMMIDGVRYDISFEDGTGNVIYITPLDTPDGEFFYKRWIGSFKNPDEFTITVEKTTFFTEGQTIYFYKIK